MTTNIFLKFLCSFPIILVVLYFIPFLGICLLLLRSFIYDNRKRISMPIILIFVGLLLLIPKGLEAIFNIIKFDASIIPYFNQIITSETYNVNFIKYSKLLLTVGVIFLIISFIFNSLFNKFRTFAGNYIRAQEKIDKEASLKNDLIMKEKREKAQNTQVVFCPYCGADNILTSKTGTCKYCRRQLQAKK